MPTGASSPIARYALHLVVQKDGRVESVGTAVLFAHGLALTADHIIQNCRNSFGIPEEETNLDFLLNAVQYGPEGGSRAFQVRQLFRSTASDLAVLALVGDPAWLPKGYPSLRLELPSVGEKVFAFGYPGSVTVNGQIADLHPNGHTSTGEILQVHPQSRDRVMAPYPCFETNARFDDGMSGGIVLDQQGNVCGLVMSTMDLDGGSGHSSFVTALYPMALIELNVPWAQHPEGQRYKLIELLSAMRDRIQGLERLSLEGEVLRYRD